MSHLIEGSGAELIRHLEKRRNQNNLILIIPEEIVPIAVSNSYPENATVRNGVPLFPTEGRLEVVTMEKIKQLQDEEE